MIRQTQLPLFPETVLVALTRVDIYSGFLHRGYICKFEKTPIGSRRPSGPQLPKVDQCLRLEIVSAESRPPCLSDRGYLLAIKRGLSNSCAQALHPGKAVVPDVAHPLKRPVFYSR